MRCSTCKEEKDDVDFHVDRRAKRGRQLVCKVCAQAYSRENWAARIVDGSRLSDEKAGRETQSEAYITKEFVEALVQANPLCFYCDTKVEFGIEIDRQRNPRALQLDRKDSDIGHFQSQVVVSCQRCNNLGRAQSFALKQHLCGLDWSSFGLAICVGEEHGEEPDNHVFELKDFSPDGLKRKICRECNSRRVKEWRAANPEKQKEQERRRREKRRRI